MLLNIAQNMLFSKYIAVLKNLIVKFIVTIHSPGGLCRPCRVWQYAGTFQ